jgi:hypothetical protein
MYSGGGLVGKHEGTETTCNTGVNGRMILNCILKEYDGRTWTGLIWLRIRTSDGLLCTR